MEERLRTDLFCSLLMANRIMTGKQILKLATEEKMKSLSGSDEPKLIYDYCAIRRIIIGKEHKNKIF